MVSTKTFDRYEAEEGFKKFNKAFNSIREDIEKARREAESQAIIDTLKEMRHIKFEFTLFFVTQMVIDILLCLAIVLK